MIAMSVFNMYITLCHNTYVIKHCYVDLWLDGHFTIDQHLNKHIANVNIDFIITGLVHELTSTKIWVHAACKLSKDRKVDANDPN
mgnify:CR=1 FL=1